MTAIAGGVEVTLTDYDVEPFDVTKAPDADIGLPIEERRPGGLGLHLIRRLVDSIEYEYRRKPAEPDHVPEDAGGTAGSGASSGTGERMLAIDYGPTGVVVSPAGWTPRRRRGAIVSRRVEGR